MILGAVCARYHSTGCPGKAWREMHGTPLIEYAIAKGLESQCDEIVVTSDIPRSVWSYNIPMIDRPEELTGPEVPKWHVWQWLLSEHPQATMIVDIDVTRPLTLAEDIDACIARLSEARDRGLEVVMAIAKADKHPAFDILDNAPWGVRLYSAPDTEYAARQQLPPVYYHGGIYAMTDRALRRSDSMWKCLVKGHEIPRERAYDIDTETDWTIVEALMARQAYLVA